MGNNNSFKTFNKLWIIVIIILIVLDASLTVFGVVKITKIDHDMNNVKKEQNDGIQFHLDSINNCLDSIPNITENKAQGRFFVDNLRKEIYLAAHDASESFVNQTGNLLTIFGIMMTIITALICAVIPFSVYKIYNIKIEEQQNRIDSIQTNFDNQKKRMDEQTEKVAVYIKSAGIFAFQIRQGVMKITEDVLAKLEQHDKNKKLKRVPDDKAIEHINSMKTESVANSEIYYELGKLYSKNQNTYDEACGAYREAVNKNPRFINAYLDWANVLKKQNRLADSWEKREKAIHLMNYTKEKSELIQALQKEQDEIEQLLFPDNCDMETKKTIWLKKNVAFNMILVKGGSFNLGETLEKEERYGLQPYQKHKVLLNNYYIGETVVTQKLWYTIMNTKPSKFDGDNLPVENISWEDANEFIETLNDYPGIKMSGMTFRLPTSAEWEYAARGGYNQDTYLYSGNDSIDEVAWYEKNAEQKTHPVKKKKPNQLKLYDMSGNVFEWCQDFWYGFLNDNDETWINPCCNHDYGLGRICRGGGWGSSMDGCKVTSVVHGHKSDAMGFRLVLEYNS